MRNIVDKIKEEFERKYGTCSWIMLDNTGKTFMLFNNSQYVSSAIVDDEGTITFTGLINDLQQLRNGYIIVIKSANEHVGTWLQKNTSNFTDVLPISFANDCVTFGKIMCNINPIRGFYMKCYKTRLDEILKALKEFENLTYIIMNNDTVMDYMGTSVSPYETVVRVMF
jgi:hypothetical protein